MAVVAEVPRRASKREGLILVGRPEQLYPQVRMYGRQRSATVTSVGQSAQSAYRKGPVLHKHEYVIRGRLRVAGWARGRSGSDCVSRQPGFESTE